jgi:FixJ family two-component response regulator
MIYIVDDDEAVRDAMRMLFESMGHSVSSHADAEDLLAHYDPEVPSCLLLDLRMPGRSGLELQEILLERGVAPPIIFLTGHGDVPAAVRALKHGAVDFIQKPVVDEQALLDRVNEAIEVHREALQTAAVHTETCRRFAELTPRETEVMEAIAAGRANKVIAIDLGISERTVEHHRGRVMHKLGVRSVAELVRLLEVAEERSS